MSTIDVKTPNGVRQGTVAELRAWVEAGEIDGSTEVRHVALTDGAWKPLAQTTLAALLKSTLDARATPEGAPSTGAIGLSEATVAKLVRRSERYRALVGQKPYATLVLMALCAAALFLVIGLCGELSPLTLFVFGSKANGAIRDGQWWRLLTAAFLHASLPHLALNLFALYVIGRLVEGAYGSAGLLVSYLGAAFFGTLASYFASPHHSVGASGAIFGLLGTALVFSVRFRRELPPQSRLILLGSLVFWLAFTLYIGFTQANVDNLAHLGGLGWGLVVALLLPSRLSEDTQQRAGRLPIRIVAALLVVATLVSIGAASRFVLDSGLVSDPEGRTVANERVSVRVPDGFRVETNTPSELVVVDWLGGYFQLELHLMSLTHRSAREELERHIRALVASKRQRIAARIISRRPATVAGHRAFEATIRIEKNGRLLICDSIVIDLDRERLFLHLYRLDRAARHFDRVTALAIRSLRILR
ncbi:MAG: rhomboid family intramembrane serine protease [Myxococcales bacterium]|nr:rhomboid family intramembrane serine protease [Myxococcales bacterium]